jgi:hypothetical protein
MVFMEEICDATISVLKRKDDAMNLKLDISEEQSIAQASPECVKEIDGVRAAWSEGLIEPAYLGLEHTRKFKENNR